MGIRREWMNNLWSNEVALTCQSCAHPHPCNTLIEQGERYCMWCEIELAWLCSWFIKWCCKSLIISYWLCAKLNDGQFYHAVVMHIHVDTTPGSQISWWLAHQLGNRGLRTIAGRRRQEYDITISIDNGWLVGRGRMEYGTKIPRSRQVMNQHIKRHAGLTEIHETYFRWALINSNFLIIIMDEFLKTIINLI